ncbi:MAG: DUF4139 domain-containing protein, partial [Deltaproteobacteria bacterium]|nr:DUF4139 domain-containing protein [Deltaproteobacteria bacterium]
MTLRTAGLVRQATGEDWTDVDLELSTAIPGQGMDLPELLTWALGEKKEFVPVARAARMPASPPRFPPPSPQPTAFEAERQAKVQVLRQRISELQNLLQTDGRNQRQSAAFLALTESSTVPADGIRSYGIGALGGKGSGISGGYRATTTSKPKPKRSRRRARHRPSPPPPPRSPSAYKSAEAPQPVMAQVMLDGDQISGELSRPEGSSTVMKAPGGSASRVRQTSLGLYEATYYRRPRFSDSSLPAVVAGGLDYVYKCPTKVNIPSKGERISVPLSVEVYPADTFYEATPSLKKTAYLKAVVENKGKRPILAGPVNIFMGGDFAGQGKLATTGSGGKLSLPMGADEDI